MKAYELHPHIFLSDWNNPNVALVKGKGMYQWDVHGNQYIDSCSGAVNVGLGYGREDMAEVMKKQAIELSYLTRFTSVPPILDECSAVMAEFTGMDIDSNGFVYATNIDEAGEQGVRRLNPRGEDVIKKGRNENVGGDLWISAAGAYSGASQITDVVYRGRGIYSLLDRKRGRIFTYDHEGNLLYIFGGIGTQEGTFNVPSAIEQWGDKLLVLDSSRAEIYIFAATEYGRLINEAVSLRFDGDEALAVELWKRVLELDENNELANSGIGKAYLSAGDNKMAMKYLKLGMNREYYSVAFKRYRSEFLKQYLGYGLTAVIAIPALVWLIGKLRDRKETRKGGAQK